MSQSSWFSLFAALVSPASAGGGRGSRAGGMEARSCLLGWLRGRLEGQLQLAPLVRRRFAGEAWQ